MSPVFSICITAYNMAPYLERAIENVVNQKTEFNIEILICDDFSTDKTYEILSRYNNAHNITIIYNKTNLGVLKSLSQLLQLARGRYIALLDADDYWISDRHLQSHYNIYEANNQIGFIFGNYKLIEEHTGRSNIGMDHNFVFPYERQFENSVINYPILTSTSSFKKELVTGTEINDYISNEFPTSDYGIYLGLMLKTKGHYLADVTTAYNFRVNSQSRKINIYDRINHIIKRHKIGDYFIARHPIDKSLLQKRNFLFNEKILLASWVSNNPDYVKEKAKQLSLSQFIRYDAKAAYIFLASKNRLLFRLCAPWVLRKRAPGK